MGASIGARSGGKRLVSSTSEQRALALGFGADDMEQSEDGVGFYAPHYSPTLVPAAPEYPIFSDKGVKTGSKMRSLALGSTKEMSRSEVRSRAHVLTVPPLFFLMFQFNQGIGFQGYLCLWQVTMRVERGNKKVRESHMQQHTCSTGSLSGDDVGLPMHERHSQAQGMDGILASQVNTLHTHRTRTHVAMPDASSCAHVGVV